MTDSALLVHATQVCPVWSRDSSSKTAKIGIFVDKENKRVPYTRSTCRAASLQKQGIWRDMAKVGCRIKNPPHCARMICSLRGSLSLEAGVTLTRRAVVAQRTRSGQRHDLRDLR